MVATSLVDLNTTSSPSLYARIRGALQPKASPNDAHASHSNEDASRAAQGSANTQETGLVCLFLVIMCYVTITYFLLGAASKRGISSLWRGGSSYGAHSFLTLIQSDSHWMASARIR